MELFKDIKSWLFLFIKSPVAPVILMFCDMKEKKTHNTETLSNFYHEIVILK